MTAHDVIVVGAGSAGAALAARLSEHASLSVLLLEAGPDYRSAGTPPEIRSLNWADSLARPEYHWPSLTARLAGGREPVLYLRGRGAGGSSAINAAGAVRGVPGDYDRWAAAGCTGWGWDDVLASFVRLEDDLDFGDRSYHGQGGPVPVGRLARQLWSGLDEAFGDAAVGIGHPWCPDVNAPGASGLYPGPLTARGGVRVSANDAYLEPARSRPNLTVLGDVLAERVRFDRGRAAGVEGRTTDGAVFFEGERVVLAAGAIHSPAILLHSGVGPPDVLRPLRIGVVASLPGVGANLCDHPMICLRLPLTAKAGPAGGLPGVCGLRATSALGDGDDLGFFPARAAGSPGGQIWAALLDPRSRGRVGITGDPAADPVVDFDMLSDPADLARLRTAAVHVLELARHPNLRALCGGAGITDVDGTTLTAGSITDEWLKARCDAYYHAVGSCRMGSPDDAGSVVGPDCHVLGVEGLYVVDASVIPVPPRAPTHLTVVMVAEHAAAHVAGIRL